MNLNTENSKLLATLAVDQTDDLSKKLIIFKEYLLKVNRQINLVSRRDTQKVIDNLIYNSLAMLPLLQYPSRAKLLDIGSGAGFPSIIHKIVRSDLRVISVDSNHRKIEFQRTVVRMLELSDYLLFAERVESLPAQNVDIMVAKAFGSLELQLELAEKHLVDGGNWVIPGSDRSNQIENIIRGKPFTIDLEHSGREYQEQLMPDNKLPVSLMIVKKLPS